jgi:hypothetical protein
MKALIGVALVFMVLVGDLLANDGDLTRDAAAFVSSTLRHIAL